MQQAPSDDLPLKLRPSYRTQFIQESREYPAGITAYRTKKALVNLSIIGSGSSNLFIRSGMTWERIASIMRKEPSPGLYSFASGSNRSCFALSRSFSARAFLPSLS
jgi:hypothetical protein